MVHKLHLGLAMAAVLGASMLVSDTAEARRRGGGSFGGFFSRSDNGCGSHGGWGRYDNGCGSHGGRYARHRHNGCGSHGGGYVQQNDCCGGYSGGASYSHGGAGYVDREGVYVEGDRYGGRSQEETRYYGGTYQDAPPAPDIDSDANFDAQSRDDRARGDLDRDRSRTDLDRNRTDEGRRTSGPTHDENVRANDRSGLEPPSPENRSAPQDRSRSDANTQDQQPESSQDQANDSGENSNANDNAASNADQGNASDQQ